LNEIKLISAMLEEVQKEKKSVALLTESYFAIREDLKRAKHQP